jgi:hypothetical protein
VFDISNVSTEVEAEMFGMQMGEYFGWSVATADLNGDGFDEIIVGAPLFSTRDKIEKGRIFIYKNNGTLDTANPIVIPGTGSKGRYGSAIVNLGDINSDGFEDIAVSAPFESRGGGGGGAEGTVYIYLGSGESVIVTTPEDEITAADISSRLGFDESRVLKSFGYSLSSGVDVDANAYNGMHTVFHLLHCRSIVGKLVSRRSSFCRSCHWRLQAADSDSLANSLHCQCLSLTLHYS